jgi:AraC family transcriptional regulator, regulatory protein of adaptative response / methylated-DNA-[protein]-cysteine methyltransferase
VTDAIHEAGFGSSSHFESTNDVRETTHAQSRDDDASADILFAIGKCSLDSILVARSQKGVCSILFGDGPILLVRDLQDQFPAANLIGDEPAYEDMVAKVIRLVENPQLRLDLPLDIRGTEFQQRVWKAVQQIPAGSTATYSDIAKKIGMPNAVRAVAEACAANVLAVAIPCHRVIRTDGALSGYRWGVERKRALLESELRA